MNALVINLDRSPERLKQTHDELTSHGIPYERISAVDGKLLEMVDGKIPGYKLIGKMIEHHYRGAAGCLFSHRKALSRAIEKNSFPCLILEDDIQIVGDITIPETAAPIIYMGGIDRKSGVYGTHAYLIRTLDAAKILLDYATKWKVSIDDCYVRLQRRRPELFYFNRPYPIQQRDGFSIIFQKNRLMSVVSRGC